MIPKIGDRIELILTNDPDSVLPGQRGLVTSVVHFRMWQEWQIGVEWDNGRKLSLVLPKDSIKIIQEGKRE